MAEPLASHVRPVRYAAGLLFVYADTPAWASRLRQQQAGLVEALRKSKELRELAGLRWRVMPREPSAERVPPSVPARSSRLSGQAAAVIAQTARTIAHPGLRAALERLADASRPSTRKPSR